MSPWLAIVGIGEDGWPGLSPAARALVETAEVLMGGARHLALVPDTGAERIVWSHLRQDLETLPRHRGRRVCVLASGDPMWFGVGATIARLLPPGEYTVVPHASAFSLAAARLAWPLQEVTTLSVHARPLEVLNLHLVPGARLLVLTQDGSTPARIAGLLNGRGFGPSPLIVFERLGGPSERRLDATAETWSGDAIDPLNTVAVECRPGPGAVSLPRLAGLPDDAFLHDGQLTKREVRAATLAALAPLPGELLWDVGAGCGSIAVEWARAGGEAVAVEKDAGRCHIIAANAARLGVPQLAVRQLAAPEGLGQLDGAPDAVFIGGGVSAPGMLEACWAALRPGGRLVANAVTVEGEAALLAWHRDHGGELVRIAVARLGATGGFHGWKPAMPVTQYIGVKR